jgi:Na+/melibiose symporter-like transporter
MAIVRHTWMFRTVAVVSVMFGLFWLFDATVSQKYAGARPYLLGGGIVAIATGVMLFRRMKLGIALSAIFAAIVAISAAVTAPQMHGPGILVVAGLAVVSGLYAALAARELFGSHP